MKRTDLFLLFWVILLTVFGLFMIYDASSFVAFRNFSDKYHYVKDQIFWAILGIGTLFLFSRFDYHRFYNLAIPILITCLVLLVLVFVPGFGVKLLGAKRWIDLKFILLQPSEFAKLALAIYLSAWFSGKEKGRLIAFLLLTSTVLGLIIIEPDMGTAAIILFETFMLYFLSGAKIIYFFVLAPFLVIIGFVFAKLEPYRAERLSAFLNSSNNLSTTSYHVKQILIALGLGGFAGVGLGNSMQKYAYLPENVTDSIFAIVAEELGFIGSIVIIGIFLAIIWSGFRIALNAKDQFGKLLAGGITAFLAAQTIINLCAQTALLPLTGIPLPFISYGGSALIIDLASIGILLNIGRQSKNI
jgi:cell division protein FtsW